MGEQEAVFASVIDKFYNLEQDAGMLNLLGKLKEELSAEKHDLRRRSKRQPTKRFAAGRMTRGQA